MSSTATIPVAVVDEIKIKRLLVRGAVIGALAGNNDVINVLAEVTDEVAATASKVS